MNKNAFFKVDTKLAELLGETYRLTEEAVKELIDNAYDADAEYFKIELPEEFASNPINRISDTSTGIKENEGNCEYLNVANSCTYRKGDPFLDLLTLASNVGIVYCQNLRTSQCTIIN
jgi:hypothetical protein